MIWADQIRRISLAQLRAQFKPRYFRTLATVPIFVDGVSTEIELISSPGHGCVRSERRWLRCHHCRGNANVLGYVRGFSWACHRCLGWRARCHPSNQQHAGGTSS